MMAEGDGEVKKEAVEAGETARAKTLTSRMVTEAIEYLADAKARAHIRCGVRRN